MANISVLRRSKKTVVMAKLVIENFLAELKAAKPGESFDSGIFKEGDNHFKLTVCPFDDSEDNNDEVFFGVENTSSVEMEGKMKLRLMCEGKKITGTKMLDITPPGGKFERGGFSMTHTECDEKIPSGKDIMLVAKLELSGKMKRFDVRERGRENRRPSTLEKVYNKMQDTDFMLMCTNEPVPCHKVILAGASPVFEAMLGNKMNEEVIEAKLVMQEISAEIGRAFVQFIYTDTVEDDVLVRGASQLLILGDKYQMPGLVQLAEGEMIKQLTRDNMVKL